MAAAFGNLKLSTKLALTVLILVATLAATVTLSLKQMAVESQRLESLVGGTVERLRLADAAKLSLVRMSRAARDLVIERTDAGKAAAAESIAAEKTALAQTRKALAAIGTDSSGASLQNLDGAVDGYAALAEQMVALAKLNSKTKAMALSSTQGAAAFAKLEQLVGHMSKSAADIVERERDVMLQRMVLSSERLGAELNRFMRIEKEIVAEIDPERLTALGKEADEVTERIGSLRSRMHSYSSSQLAPPEM